MLITRWKDPGSRSVDLRGPGKSSRREGCGRCGTQSVIPLTYFKGDTVE